jgi:hypothetical protein
MTIIVTMQEQTYEAPLPPGSPPKEELRQFMSDCEAGNEAEVAAYLKRWPAFAEVQWHNIEYSSLMLAAQNGHDKIVKTLLDAGCPIHTKSADGDTALFRALTYGRLSTVKLLLEEGADLSLRAPRSGKTGLMTAVYSGSAELVNFMLAIGEKADERDGYGRNALHELRWCNDPENDFAPLLVKHGADVNAKSMNGDTPIAEIMFGLRAKAIRQLLDLGADPEESSVILAKPRVNHEEINRMLDDEPFRRERVRQAAVEAELQKVRDRETAIENAVHGGMIRPVKPMRLRLK